MSSCLGVATGCSLCNFRDWHIIYEDSWPDCVCRIANCSSVIVEPDMPGCMPAHISLRVLMSWHWLLQQHKNRLQAEKIGKYRNLKSRGPILAGYGSTKPYLSYHYTDLCDLEEGERGTWLFWLQKSKLCSSSVFCWVVEQIVHLLDLWR